MKTLNHLPARAAILPRSSVVSAESSLREAEGVLAVAPVPISPALRWYRRTALQNQLNGLTCKGQVRRRRPNAKTAADRLALRRERGLRAWNNRLARFREQGLTSRGTPRIYLVRRGDALLLKTEIDALAQAVAASFSDLSPAAQARALALEASLSVIRKQII